MSATSVKNWRVTLVVLGLLLLALGAYVMVDTVTPVKIAGVALWFLLALILHDGIIALVTFGVAFHLRKAGRKVPIAVLAMVQAGLWCAPSSRSSCSPRHTKNPSAPTTRRFSRSTTHRHW